MLCENNAMKKGESDSPSSLLSSITQIYGAYENGPDKPTLFGFGLQFWPKSV